MPQTTTATNTQALPVRPPKPRYEGLFREPVYLDGVYDRTDGDDDNPPE
jgi:hypothetical protein